MHTWQAQMACHACGGLASAHSQAPAQPLTHPHPLQQHGEGEKQEEQEGEREDW